ncbi:MAG: hypothetical protein HQL39_19200 [Alphaproteobacteria bacterium]|nr:hypothetical protein [Alphaproteobacteria bacterium]
MERSLLRSEIAPFIAAFSALIAATILGDLALHLFGLVWIGRWLGIPGVALIALSFLYSLRKRRLIAAGDPRVFLRLHEFLTWGGALMILVHAGVHFNAVLPWLALLAMLANVGSGLTGKFLLDRGRRHLVEKKAAIQRRGLSAGDLQREIFWDATTLDTMAKWRKVHFPVTIAFSALTVGHVLSILLLWNWR